MVKPSTISKALVTLSLGKVTISDTIPHNGNEMDALRKVMKYKGLKGEWKIKSIEIKGKLGLYEAPTADTKTIGQGSNQKGKGKDGMDKPDHFNDEMESN